MVDTINNPGVHWTHARDPDTHVSWDIELSRPDVYGGALISMRIKTQDDGDDIGLSRVLLTPSDAQRLITQLQKLTSYE